jgi:hypothetical protein
VKKTNTKDVNPKHAIGIMKAPLHLVSPIAIIYNSIAKYLGASKYGAWNFRGTEITASVYMAALQRHMLRWWSGEENDPVDNTPHLANAMACLEILIEGSFIGNMVDDRPPRIDIARAIKMVEDLMPQIAKRYGHMKPKHWTINDKTAGSSGRDSVRRHRATKKEMHKRAAPYIPAAMHKARVLHARRRKV